MRWSQFRGKCCFMASASRRDASTGSRGASEATSPDLGRSEKSIPEGSQPVASM